MWHDRLVRLSSARSARRLALSFCAMLVVMNLSATVFARVYGVGLLDLAGGANVLDAQGRAGYSPARAYQLLTAYGPAGRGAHLLLVLPDLVLPAVAALFMLSANIYLWRSLLAGRRLAWLAGVPAPLYALADYSENVGIVTLLLSYPARRDHVAALTDLARLLKGWTSGLGLALMAAGLVLLTLREIVRRHNRPGIAGAGVDSDRPYHL